MISIIFSAEGRMNTKKRRLLEYKKITLSNNYPLSYKTNSTKEELCYEYIRTFTEQFQSIYPKRKSPLMIVENECGISKFVCNFIHPSHVPYTEMYDLHECSSYFAGFIQYEPLDPLNEPPSVILSPSKTLDCHIGDCFDMSVLLVSYLLGNGYDAYIVNGYAPKYIALKDQTMSICPIASGPKIHISQKVLAQIAENNARRQSIMEDKPENLGPVITAYNVKENPILDSRYIKEETEKELEAMKDPFRLWIQDELPDVIDESSKESCVHSWVLISSGQREIKENLFIEPSTGKLYNIATSPYLGIESIWNHTNYWINLQNEKSPKEMEYDLVKTIHWESLFLPSKDIKSRDATNRNNDDDDNTTSHRIPISTYNADNMNTISSSIASINVYRTLDAPSTWVEPLKLSREKYFLRYPPYGKRTITYYCCKVDYFSKYQYLKTSNLIMRITQYLDKECTIIKNITEYYENRKDKLYKRIRNYINTSVSSSNKTITLGKSNSTSINTYHFIEYFHPGNSGEIKEYIEYPGKYININFYVDGRLDRMVKREEYIGHSIIEYFNNRNDFLIQRKVEYTLDSSLVGNRIFTLPIGQTSDSTITNDAQATINLTNLLLNKSPKGSKSTKSNKNVTNTSSNNVVNANNSNNAISSITNTNDNTVNNNTKEYYILSMTQLYEVNPKNTDHSNEIYSRYYNIPDGKLIIQYHHAINDINRKTVTYYHAKNGLLGSNTSNNMNDVIFQMIQSQETGLNENYEQLQEAGMSERDCHHQIKTSYYEINKIYSDHNDLYQSNNINLVDCTVYDMALDRSFGMLMYNNNNNLSNVQAANNAANDNSQRKKSIDYLTPYLHNYKDISNLTKEDIDKIKQNCREALQSRIIERTNIIQNRLNDENMKLVRKQEQFQRSQRDGDFSTEEYEKYCTEAMFRIQILERRLLTYKETALVKFKELDSKLQNDPRLQLSKV